jgi:hypothetical protein
MPQPRGTSCVTNMICSLEMTPVHCIFSFSFVELIELSTQDDVSQTCATYSSGPAPTQTISNNQERQFKQHISATTRVSSGNSLISPETFACLRVAPSALVHPRNRIAAWLQVHSSKDRIKAFLRFAHWGGFMMTGYRLGKPRGKIDSSESAQFPGDPSVRLHQVLHMAAAAIQPISTPEPGTGFDIVSQNGTQIQFMDTDFVRQNVRGVLKVGVKVIGRFAFSVRLCFFACN